MFADAIATGATVGINQTKRSLVNNGIITKPQFGSELDHTINPGGGWIIALPTSARGRMRQLRIRQPA